MYLAYRNYRYLGNNNHYNPSYLIIVYCQMIGTINQGGATQLVYCTVSKTSNSGISSNRRLAVLSIPAATMGYISKIPQPLDSFYCDNWIQKCKEFVNFRATQYLNYVIDQDDQRLLIVSWKSNQQKVWEFKFQTPQSAKEWTNYMAIALNPAQSILPPLPPTIVEQQEPPPSSLNQKDKQHEKLPEEHPDYSKLRDTRSRFKEPQVVEDHQFSQEFVSPPHTVRHRIEPKPHLLNRFQKYEENTQGSQLTDIQTLPIISTFKQRFAHHNMISNMDRPPRQDNFREDSTDWNLRWFEAIQNQSQNNRIDIYNSFVKTAEGICMNIVKQLNKAKREREYIPERQSNHQEVYNVQGVTYKMIMPDLMKSCLNEENERVVRETRQELVNMRFILKATFNKKGIKVPLACIVKYMGFFFYCQANPPPQFKVIDKASLPIFKNQILNYEETLKLRISTTEIILYTNRPQGFQAYNSQGCYIIAYNVKGLLPREKTANSSHSFNVTPQYIMSRSHNFFSIESGKVQKDVAEGIDLFLGEESTHCTIISVDDLEDSLKRYKLSKELICQIMKKCNNKYLYSILASETVAVHFQHVAWMAASLFAASDQIRYDPIEFLMDYLYRLLVSLLSKNGQTWNSISSYIFDQDQVVIKQEDLRLGYLFSSISVKLGIEFDYQLLMRFRESYFQERQYLPKDSIKGHKAVIERFLPEEISENWQLAISHLQSPKRTEQTFSQIITFFNLRSGEPRIDQTSYQWRKICNFLSDFVPFQQQQEYLHLNIYQQTDPEHIDFQIFSTLQSVIKWLLLDKSISRAEIIVDRFKRDTWFWVGEHNFFSMGLDELTGDYYQKEGKLGRAIERFNSNNAEIKNLFVEGAEGYCVGRNLKLAKLLKLCGRHKESLQKFKMMHKEMKKQRKEPDMMLFLMIEIASLYLHLGDLQKSLYFCKEAIDFSTFQSFPTEEQEFSAYELILRCLEIKDEKAKYKFYVGILEEKFGGTQKWYLLQQVMRTTLSQLFIDLPAYLVKKIVYFLYHLQASEGEEAEVRGKDPQDLFRQIKKTSTEESLPKAFRYSLQKCSYLIDEFALSGQKKQEEDLFHMQRELQEVRILSVMLLFVGSEYVLGRAADRLAQRSC